MVRIALTTGGALQTTIFTPAQFFDDTSGMIGIYNGDQSDDLTARDNTRLDLATATEQDIYHQFGESCKICIHIYELV